MFENFWAKWSKNNFFFLDSSSSFEQEQVGFCEILENNSSFCTRKGVKNLTHKNFELYELQWSGLLHLWSIKEATGDEKKWCVEEEFFFFLGFTVCKTGEYIYIYIYIIK